MADVINLNRVRKAKKRTEDVQKAEQNRVRFGRAKSLKRKDEQDRLQRTQDLDGKKLD